MQQKQNPQPWITRQSLRVWVPRVGRFTQHFFSVVCLKIENVEEEITVGVFQTLSCDN